VAEQSLLDGGRTAEVCLMPLVSKFDLQVAPHRPVRHTNSVTRLAKFLFAGVIFDIDIDIDIDNYILSYSEMSYYWT
jgi:hypothetical protein